MLREFRTDDVARYYALLARYFPEEQALLGYRPEAFDRIVRRVFRWDARLLLGLLDRLRRPVVKFLVVEADGSLCATAILTFTARAGFVGSVMVDEPYRRRGFARTLLARCAVEARRAGRRYLALDVLEGNAPARALYDSLGFRPLRAQAYFVRPDGPSPPVAPADAAAVRPFDRRDARALLPVAAAALDLDVAGVLPATRGQFFVGDVVVRGLESTTAAWVVDRGAGAVGFARATVSSAMEAGNLTAPLLDPAVPPEVGRALVTTAVAWAASHGAGRVLTMAPRGPGAGTRALREAGFHEAYGVETLYREIAA